MTNIPDKVAAVARFGLPAGIVMALVNYLGMQSAGEAVDITEMLKYLGGPIAGGFAISSTASPIERLKDWFGKRDGGGDTLGLLESLKVILEQFKAKGIPDQVSMTVQWGDEVYEFDWAKRTRKDAE
jgi:hypothetical protein